MAESARKKTKVSEPESSSAAGPPKPQTPEERNSHYAQFTYPSLLEEKGGFMRGHENGLSPEEADLCKNLLSSQQATPVGTLFDDDVFPMTLKTLEKVNEARLCNDIGRLFTPSAEDMAVRQSEMESLNALTESVDELWSLSVAVAGCRPKPDYFVGFRPTAFSVEQRRKLDLRHNTPSLYRATNGILFPFQTTELKCSNAVLDVADRQNAHSMTVAFRGIANLFRRSGCHEQLDGKIFGFSIMK